MVPSKLKRHLEGKHESVVLKEKKKFLRLKAQNSKQLNFTKDFSTVLNKPLKQVTPLQILLLKLSNFILYNRRKLSSNMLSGNLKIVINESAVKEVKKVSLSDNSMSRRIDDILSQRKDS